MRPLLSFLAAVIAVGLPACGIEQLMQQGGSGSAEGSDGGDAGVEAGVTGAGCGTERQTGITLCAATSMCPNVVVDTQALPSCGFRIRGPSVDLVCGCGEQVCPMGVFATCAQAVALLTSQTEAQVCAQIGEGRCTDVTGSSEATSTSSSSSGGSSSGGIGCDRECMQQCGGGEACASVCNCQ